ncbi:MAG: hypothetical protein WBA63_04900 [Thermomicrobiales bacterium]
MPEQPHTGRYRYLSIHDLDAAAHGQQLVTIFAAVRQQGATIVSIAQGIGPLERDGDPEHWAQLIIYEPPTVAKDVPSDMLQSMPSASVQA